MQGGILRASILLIAAAAAMSVTTVEAEINGSESGHLSTSSKLLTDLSMAALNSPAVGLLDPLGITKQSRDNIVKAALRLPQPKDYIAAAIRLSLQQFKNVINGVADFAKLADDSLNRMAIDDCRELMNYAIEELQDSMTSVDECPLLSLVQRLSDLKNWLSAVLSYSNTCIDGFTKPDLQSGINGVLQNSIAHTGQALSIVSAIPQILTSLNPPQNQAVSARKGYPAATAASSGSGSAAAASSSANDASSGETESNDSLSFSSSGEERRASSSNREHSFSSSSGESTIVGGEEDTARNGRSLKGVHFPAWMKKSDRKMLMARNVGGRGGQVRGSVSVQPNVVVAKDGSGQYTSIADALKAYNPGPEGNGTTRYIIYIKAGVYDEDVLITRKQPNIFMYGDGPTKTIVTGKKCNRDGVSTFRTAPFAVVGKGFICKDMGFENTAGPEGHQAVALRVQSDMSAFYNCRMDGYQDTLYTQTHRQFYSNCIITGTVDFIFGDAAAVIQNSVIIVRKPMDNQQNSVTAHGRTHMAEPTGLVIQNCQIIAEDTLEAKKVDIPSYLGRPWKPYSRTVILHSTIGDFIKPEGWMPWAGDIGLDTCYYAEFGNRGPGADTSNRVNWKGYHVLANANDATRFTVERFIQGSHWLPGTGAPFFLGLKSI